MSLNQDVNYSRIFKTREFVSDSITDNISVIANGTVTNLNNPVSSDDIATKYYVDNFLDPGSVSMPLNSVQINTGSSFIGSEYLTFSNDILTIYNKFNIGQINITDNVVSNVNNPVLQTGATTYNYFLGSNITYTTFSTTNNSNSLTSSQIVNKYLVRTITNSDTIIQDLLPDTITDYDTDNYSFEFYYYFTGTASSVLLFGTIIPMGNFKNYNNPLNVITVPQKTLVHLTGTVLSGSITYYIKNYQYLYAEPKITNIGLYTDKFNSLHNDYTKSSFIIYPIVKTTVNSSTQHTYTYSDIKNKLIIRTGLTGNTTDTFDILSDFITDSAWSLGTGKIKFVIQNISNYDLSIGDNMAIPTGWSWNTTYTRTIASGKNGIFYINYDGTTLYLYCIAIVSRNG